MSKKKYVILDKNTGEVIKETTIVPKIPDADYYQNAAKDIVAMTQYVKAVKGLINVLI